MTKFKIYDNGGATLDRYTIIDQTPQGNAGDPYYITIGTSGNPAEFWQHGETKEPTSGPGEEIRAKDLPAEALEQLKKEIEENN